MVKAEQKRSRTDLELLGFRSIGSWQIAGEWLGYGVLEGAHDKSAALTSVSNALYAFCIGSNVLYIGKTSQSLKNRFKGYCKPGSTQSTNKKCHAHIKAALAKGLSVDILAFAAPDDLQYRGYAINLAGGLEDVLIRGFTPPWNGSAKGGWLSESSVTEAQQLADDPAPAPAVETDMAPAEVGRFFISLSQTYYTKGIVNPGMGVSNLFGETDELLTICFSDGTSAVTTRIDRRANRNGSVRFVGSNQAIALWFQSHFLLGQTVEVRILAPYLIEMLAVPGAISS